MPTTASIALSLFAAVGLCKVYEDVADLPGLQYDFVVVGGSCKGLEISPLILILTFRGNVGQRRGESLDRRPERVGLGVGGRRKVSTYALTLELSFLTRRASNEGVLPSEVPFLLGELFEGDNIYNWSR